MQLKLINSIVLTIGLTFYFIGCYTIIKRIPLSDREANNQRVMNRELKIDNSLLGLWSNRVMVMDGDDQIRNVNFYQDGKIYFSSRGSVTNGGYRGGKYRIFDDTLVVYLASSYFIERYLYKIESNHLRLTSLKEDKNESYALVEYRASLYIRNN